MTLEELLKTEDYIRVDLRNRWLLWESLRAEWQVWTRERYAHDSKLLYYGQDLSAAIEALKEETK